MLEEEARGFTSREMREKSLHKLGRQLSTQLRGVDDSGELLQHVGGVLHDELSLERPVGVGQIVCRLQDVLELGHSQLLQGWECEIQPQVWIHHVQPVKRGFC